MVREIEKLGLTQKQYGVLGTTMMVLCISLSAGAFFLADASLALGIAFAVVAVEFGFVGYCFRKVSVELASCDDPALLAKHKPSEKSQRNTTAVSLFVTLISLVCVLCVIAIGDFRFTKEVPEPVAQSEQAAQMYETDDVPEDDVIQPEIVYATPSGKRYHYSAECAGKTSFAITMEEALNHSLTPCKKCADE